MHKEKFQLPLQTSTTKQKATMLVVDIKLRWCKLHTCIEPLRVDFFRCLASSGSAYNDLNINPLCRSFWTLRRNSIHSA